RADAKAVRPGAVGALTQLVPLRPALLHLAIAIERVEAIAPHTPRRVGEDVDLARAGVTLRAGWQRIGQFGLAALRDEDPVGRLGEDTGVAAEGIPRLRERLVPAADEVGQAEARRAPYLFLLPGG